MVILIFLLIVLDLIKHYLLVKMTLVGGKGFLLLPPWQSHYTLFFGVSVSLFIS